MPHDPQGSPRRIGADVDGGARVLIVDDHVMLRESMRVALELAGIDVVAGSMLRELTASDDVRHDLITKRDADVLQPVADGYSTGEVASRLLVNDRTVSRELSSAYGKIDARDAPKRS